MELGGHVVADEPAEKQLFRSCSRSPPSKAVDTTQFQFYIKKTFLVKKNSLMEPQSHSIFKASRIHQYFHVVFNSQTIQATFQERPFLCKTIVFNLNFIHSAQYHIRERLIKPKKGVGWNYLFH